MKQIFKTEMKRAMSGKGMVLSMLIGTVLGIAHVIREIIPAYRANLTNFYNEFPILSPHSAAETWMAGSPSNFLSRIGGECRSGNIFGFERGGAMSARPFRPGWNAGFAAVWRQKAFLPAILRRTPRRIKADCAFQMPEFFAGIPACCEGRSRKAPR